MHALPMCTGSHTHTDTHTHTQTHTHTHTHSIHAATMQRLVLYRICVSDNSVPIVSLAQRDIAEQEFSLLLYFVTTCNERVHVYILPPSKFKWIKLISNRFSLIQLRSGLIEVLVYMHEALRLRCTYTCWSRSLSEQE